MKLLPFKQSDSLLAFFQIYLLIRDADKGLLANAIPLLLLVGCVFLFLLNRLFPDDHPHTQKRG
ncbi:hypothetical protein JCM19046_3442 [Bacillus sp. JCM 19046]|nr:hypothetical protein JCM19045_3087 [Bacillus sp. JCM 19045]GAF18836.1 hypothetical protein JCM19046_3442 [Bacillus sp. JCM 19046]